MAVTKLVIELGEPAETGTLRTRLAGALGDPSLLIAYWLPEANEYVDERGDPVALPGPDSGRAVTLIDDRGERIAALVHDPAVMDDPALVEAVSSAARIAISNVRLRAEVRNQMDELAASRRRILTASDDQRRRIEFELRKGVEQRLETVGRLLADIRADPTADATAIEEVEQELSGARRELHDFAGGLLPTSLTEGGLSAALPALARRAPLPVSLSVEVGHLPPAVESTVYFVCSEALTNVAKHASAEHASVAVTGDSLHVEVRVDDDGVGGVDPARGSGLRGLIDRVEALGGRLLVESPLGGGTEVVVSIPVE
jgi:signal transduction histidine kinase